MRVSVALQTIGAALIATGAGFIYFPAGMILAGLFAVAFGVAIERANAK